MSSFHCSYGLMCSSEGRSELKVSWRHAWAVHDEKKTRGCCFMTFSVLVETMKVFMQIALDLKETLNKFWMNFLNFNKFCTNFKQIFWILTSFEQILYKFWTGFLNFDKFCTNFEQISWILTNFDKFWTNFDKFWRFSFDCCFVIFNGLNEFLQQVIAII